MSQLRPHGYPIRQPVEFGRLNPAEQVTGFNSTLLPPSSGPHNPAAEFAGDPPPYEDLSSVPPAVKQNLAI